MAFRILTRIFVEVTDEFVRSRVSQNPGPVQTAQIQIAVGGNDTDLIVRVSYEGKIDRSAAEIELEDAVQAFLVSATFKDCSLLVRLSRSSENESGERVQSETKLVDLDRKPFAKLHSMQQTDSEVCAAFLAWLQTLDSAPAASVAA